MGGVLLYAFNLYFLSYNQIMLNAIKSLMAPAATKTTAGKLAEQFGLELRGNPNTVVSGVAPIADARAGQLAFYSTEQNSTAFKILPIDVLRNTRASVILVQPEHASDAPAGATLLITPSPRGNIVKILGEIYKTPVKHGISRRATIASGVFFRNRRSVYVAQNAIIESGAVIEPDVQIHSGAYIGRNVTIGRGTIVHHNAHIENATIGADCIIHTGAVIGKDGFGYTRQDGHNVFIPHVGRVVIGNRVSVGANTCIDRGAMADTTIGDGTKIDNLCQIAHNVTIGQECFLAGGVGLAGGVVIGDRALLGGHVGIANGVHIGHDAEVGAQSGVFRDVPDGARHLGYPSEQAFSFMRKQAWLNKQINKKD